MFVVHLPEGTQLPDTVDELRALVTEYTRLHGEEAAARDIVIIEASGGNNVVTGRRLDVLQFAAVL